MNKWTILALTASALLLTSCAGTTPPAVSPQGQDRYLTDPRVGFSSTATPDLETRLETAWRLFLRGEYAQTRRQLADIRSRAPEYTPAALLEAMVDLREGNINTAQAAVNRIRERNPQYTAAQVVAGEIALAENDTRGALAIYRVIAQRPDAPNTAAERVATLEKTLTDELMAAAQSASDADAIRLLAEVLSINQASDDARMLLVGKLIKERQFEEARRYLDPLLSSASDRSNVQEALAEIDAGRGRYQEAIVRYERLARRDSNPRYQQRLEQIKEQWSLANMPPQFQTALESEAITRADLAILLYWKVSSVHFAQNLGAPPIAIDIDVPGREEIIRAIAVGLYEVDPVTRRVFPQRLIPAAALARQAARILSLRGASCARGIPLDRVLAACATTDPLATSGPDTPMTGRQTARLLDEIERALGR